MNKEECCKNHKPNGDVPGSLPDRGVSTGVTDTYGGGLDRGFQNRRSITADTGSDAERRPGGMAKGDA